VLQGPAIRLPIAKSKNAAVERLPETMTAPRLTLRQWVAADAPSLSAAVAENLDHLRPWMPWISSEPLSALNRVGLITQWRSEWERGGDVVIGALLGGAVVGSAGLHRRRGPGIFEIGYWVHRAHTRKGYASEIARALTTVAFTVPGIDRVEIHHDKANVASAGVPRSLGFTFAGETADSVTSPGEVGIDCRWTIDRQRWTAKVAVAR
jgi:ribosomal-protein-serine acetyltransferase